MKKFLILIMLIGLATGGWWLWDTQPDIRQTVMQYVDNGDLATLEARYSPETIMQKNRNALLEDNQHSFQEPIVKFYPYLLMDVKYVQADKKTREGVVLWCLTDGEMVLDTDNWDKTHGFEDAINAGANRNDFRIIYALAKNGGSLSRERLQRELQVEGETLLPWIENAIEKHLIVRQDGELQLHLENPKIAAIPQTRMKQNLVNKPSNQAQRTSKNYSHSQVEKIAKAAFGPSFTIRNAKEVYLPVYWIGVLNPDETVHISHWNAVTGTRI